MMRRNAVWVLASGLMFLVGGCDGGAASDGPEVAIGTVRVALNVEGTNVKFVEYSVSADDLGAPITGKQKVESDGTVDAKINKIPAGQDRVLTLVAKDQEGVQLCEGAATFDVQKGQTATVNVVLQCGKKNYGDIDVNGEFNIEPVIHSVFVADGTLESGASTQVEVTASDSDGDPLTYTWTATEGTFAPTDSAASTYTAGTTIGQATLTITVTDGRGGEASAAVAVDVTEAGVIPPGCDEGGTVGSVTLGYDSYYFDLDSGTVTADPWALGAGPEWDIMIAYDYASTYHAVVGPHGASGVWMAALPGRVFSEVTTCDVATAELSQNLPVSFGPDMVILVQANLGGAFFKIGNPVEDPVTNTVTFDYAPL